MAHHTLVEFVEMMVPEGEMHRLTSSHFMCEETRGQAVVNNGASG